MKTVKRSFLNLAIEVVLDEEGYVQKSRLIKNKNYPVFHAEDFRFDLKKIADLTPFRRKVYQALLKVPPGQTVTYKDLAQKVGNPKASRAVGSAMAKNEAVYFIPCHRVVKSCGSLGAYSGLGGVKTKKNILDYESQINPH